MKFLWIALFVALIFGQTGCETFGGKPPTKSEIAVRKVNLNGLLLGDREKKMIKLFPQAKLMPFGRSDRRVFEIENPNPHISLAVAYFVNDQLIKLELRYFNGPGVRTLSSAGGWDGLRDYLIAKFGAPTRVGENVPLQTEAGDMNAKYAKFNGEWNFPKQQRLVQYITFSDSSGGIGVVTFVDTALLLSDQEIARASQSSSRSGVRKESSSAAQMVVTAPNPGF
jgi:hypothetical protein